MAEWTDLLLNVDGDLLIVNGDFVTGDSVQQDIEQFLLHNKGAFVCAPLVGTGALAMVNMRSTDVAAMLAEIKLQLEADGMKDVSIEQVNGEYIINGTR